MHVLDGVVQPFRVTHLAGLASPAARVLFDEQTLGAVETCVVTLDAEGSAVPVQGLKREPVGDLLCRIAIEVLEGLGIAEESPKPAGLIARLDGTDVPWPRMDPERSAAVADDLPIAGDDVGLVGRADVEAVESRADNIRRAYIAALGKHSGPFVGGGRRQELLPRGHGPRFEVLKHERGRSAETRKASASQPIEPSSRYGDDPLEGCIDKPDWIRKPQVHFQSMPVREQKLWPRHTCP
jgi:hypothetical protein